MRIKLIYFMAGLLMAVAVGLGALAVRGQGTIEGQRWEYLNVIAGRGRTGMIVMADGELVSNTETFSSFDDVLNLYGPDGWELVAATQDPISGMDFYFKRPLQE